MYLPRFESSSDRRESMQKRILFRIGIAIISTNLRNERDHPNDAEDRVAQQTLQQFVLMHSSRTVAHIWPH